jgi:hypothetical protein
MTAARFLVLLQDSSPVIVTPTIENKILGKLRFSPGFPKFLRHSGKVSRIGAFGWENPAFPPCARSCLENVKSTTKRFARYGLTLHPEKTRLLEFGRYAEERAKRQGRKKPGTFDFLGLTHICARSRRGKFTVHVRTMRKRLRRSLTAVAEWCQEHRHAPVDEQQKTLNAKLRGHYQYYGRPTNSQSLLKFYGAS